MQHRVDSPLNLRKRAALGLAASALAAAVLGGCMEPATSAKPDGEANTLATALSLPSSFTDAQVAAGLVKPTVMAFAPDGRIFVNEKGGTVRIIKNGALLPAPFLSLAANVNVAGENGLMGLALDPAFASNHFVYVSYLSNVEPHLRVSRFTANGDVAVAGSESALIDMPTLPTAANNGGGIKFGKDGKLYIGTGDSHFDADAANSASTRGKLLRLNADGSIPSDNPFFATATGLGKAIWAYGLRNAFSFAFQPGTGKLFLNDVGWNNWEEINEIVMGGNYGWPATERATTNPAYKTPFLAYGHATGGCAVISGAFYNPAVPAFPAENVGAYFFGDYCNGISRLDPATKAIVSFGTSSQAPTDLQVGSDGALYYVSHFNGTIRKITYNNTGAPVISQHPANTVAFAGASASFSVLATGAAPLGYQWQRNLVNIAGANAATYVRANLQASDNGARFRCIISNGLGVVQSAEAVLTVNAPIVLEAESALLSGPVVANNQAGYTGTGFADFTNASNDFVEWTANLPAAGARTLDFRYALGAATGRPLRITVNGTVVNASLAFAPTGSWATWKPVTITATLNAGANKIRATAIGSNGSNLDKLTIH